MNYIKHLLLLVFLFNPVFSFSNTLQKTDPYTAGMDLYVAGNINGALQVWASAYKSTTSEQQIDPRIGTAFVQAVSEYKLVHLYPIATNIFYWSLKSRGTGEYEEYLRREIQKSASVFDRSRFKDVDKTAKKDPYKAAGIVLSHWKSLDPTPETPENERLIEHGERIAYIKKHFTENDNTVFDTDERSWTYLRYGAPDLLHKGTLEFNEHNMKSMANEAMTQVPALDRIDKVDSLISNTMIFYKEPKYELWLYKNLTKAGYVIKMFGESYHKRTFGEIESLTDFVPKSAFMKSRSSHYNLVWGPKVEAGTGRGEPNSTIAKKKHLSPGTLLLLSYTRQLMVYHTTFESLFLNLKKSFGMNGPNVSPSWISSQKSVLSMQRERVLQTAPDQRSLHLNELRPLEVNSHQYLFYNEHNQPYYLSVMNSYPQAELLYLISKNEVEDVNRYRLNHNLSVTSYGGEEVPSVSHAPTIPFENDGILHPAQSIFKIPVPESNLSLTYSAQVYDQEASGMRKGRVLPASLKASGMATSEESQKPESPSAFALSDILIGYQTDSLQWEEDIPFLVSLDGNIPDSTNLFMHFQVINLQPNESNISQMKVEFYVKERGGFLKKLFGKKDQNRISVTLEDYSDQIEETLEVELADREPGKYELVIEATDLGSGNSISKIIPFSIVEP
ncbi:MAG: GWxTD domain-containing protein [Balneolaceae bacterium]|nr:GWxTD domain-containing protein [Balneolaceae bacterium]